MSALDRLAKSGTLPALAEYGDPGHIYAMDDERVYIDKTVADAALAEAYAVIERQAGENAAWRRSHDVWCDDLANIDSLKQRAEKAEAEARRWEWLAKEASLGHRTPDGPLLDTLLARYEEAHHA